MNGGDVDMDDENSHMRDGHSLTPGSNYYDNAEEEYIEEDSEDEDEIYYVPETLPKIEWGAYCNARQEVENYCAIYVGDYDTNNPGVTATFEEILMTEMHEIIYHFCDRNPHHATQYKMVFTDYANYIWNKHKNDLQAPTQLIYMGRYQLYYYVENGNGAYYDWFLNHGIKPTGNWQKDAQTAENIELQKRQRQADADNDMADAFGGMRVHSRLPTVIPRSRTVRDVVGRAAASRKTKCAGGDCAGPQQSSARSSAPQARRGGGRSRPSRQSIGS